jgi:hypothetical protein
MENKVKNSIKIQIKQRHNRLNNLQTKIYNKALQNNKYQ